MSYDIYNQVSGNIPTPKAIQEEGNSGGDDDDHRTHGMRRIPPSVITDLPGDCLNLIFKCLKSRDDHNSFGLTCHQLLHVQNNNRKSLRYSPHYGSHTYPRVRPESFRIVFNKLLIRFQHLESLSLSLYSTSNNESVIMISRSCPFLKYLILSNCDEVELEGWEAIGRNCKNLELLYVYSSRRLCDLGLQALCNGCNKLWILSISMDNSCSSSALELFKRKKPDVLYLDDDFLNF